jgi:hypothetical protein
MTYMSHIAAFAPAPVSPLTLSDHLLRLAEEADGAGFRVAAEHLVVLASQVLDEPAALHI